MRSNPVLRQLLGPLSSRKVRVAVTTVLVAFTAQLGWEVSAELIFTILGVGASLILGIAHEDAGRWSGVSKRESAPGVGNAHPTKGQRPPSEGATPALRGGRR